MKAVLSMLLIVGDKRYQLEIDHLIVPAVQLADS